MFSPTPPVTYGARISPRVPLPRFNTWSTLTPGANAMAPKLLSQLSEARISNMFGDRDRTPIRASTGAASWTPEPPLLPRLTYWNARSIPNSCFGPVSAAARRCAAARVGVTKSAAASTALPISFRIGMTLPARS